MGSRLERVTTATIDAGRTLRRIVHDRLLKVKVRGRSNFGWRWGTCDDYRFWQRSDELDE